MVKDVGATLLVEGNKVLNRDGGLGGKDWLASGGEPIGEEAVGRRVKKEVGGAGCCCCIEACC